MIDKDKFRREWGKFFRSNLEGHKRTLDEERKSYPFVKLFQHLAQIRDGKVVASPAVESIPLKYIDASLKPACAADTGMDEEIVMITDDQEGDGFSISTVPNPERLAVPCQMQASWYFLGLYLCHKHMDAIRTTLKQAWDERDQA